MAFDLKEALAAKRRNPPLRNYLWHVVLPDPNANEFYTGDDEKVSFTVEQRKDMNHRVLSITAPQMTMATDKIITGNTFWYTAGTNDIGNVSMEIEEYEDGLTLRYIEALKGLWGNSNNTYNPPAAYKRDIRLYRMSTTREDIIEHVYKGYFISGFSDTSNNYEDSGIQKYSIEFTGDAVVNNVLSVASLAAKPQEAELLAKRMVVDKSFSGIDGDDAFSIIDELLGGVFP